MLLKSVVCNDRDAKSDDEPPTHTTRGGVLLHRLDKANTACLFAINKC
jgi:hypothetical protein